MNYEEMKSYGSRKFSIKRLYRNFVVTWNQLFTRISNQYRLCQLFFSSFLYNSQLDAYYFIDTLFDPLFYIVDHYLKYCGTVFVLIVFFILLAFISFAYIIGVPYWYYRCKLVLAIAWIIGHWLLINVIWNYFKSLYTLPGLAIDKPVVLEVASFCKKCYVPKPPRCHHCSLCNKCILKMDHHCPWLNNCIGHYNHRYFYFFCAYTWLGTIFVMAFGVWIALDHWFPEYSPFPTIDMLSSSSETTNLVIKIIQILNRPKVKTKLMVFEAIITVLLFILLGLLLRYHTILITNGETCIERYINRKCRQHYAQYNVPYRNPYDFGPKQNWRRFLGFDRNRNPWRHILFPSNFGPIGDGFSWKTISDEI